MAKRRISRKQIKRKDQFMTRAEKITLWLTVQGWKKVLFTLVLIGILLMLFIFANKNFSSKRDEATSAYAGALATYINASQPAEGQFIQNKEQLTKALKEFEAVMENYGSSVSAEMAAYYRIQCLFKLGEDKKAFQAGMALFNDASEDLVQNLTGLFLYDKYIAAEKYPEARKMIAELEDNSNTMLNMNQVYYLSGRLYELENKKNEAVQEYLKVLKNEDLYYYKTEAQQRIASLDPKALQEARKTEE
jgi:predicted negative regulator of RcsB-dependent stress response